MGTFKKTSVKKGIQTMKLFKIFGLFLTTVGTLSQHISSESMLEQNMIEDFERQQETGMRFFLSERRLEDSYKDITVIFPDGYTDKIILERHFFNEEQRM